MHWLSCSLCSMHKLATHVYSLAVALTASKWAHVGILCVDLGDVRHSLAEHVHRDLVGVLVLELCSLLPCTPNLGPAVSYTEERRTQCGRDVSESLNGLTLEQTCIIPCLVLFPGLMRNSRVQVNAQA